MGEWFDPTKWTQVPFEDEMKGPLAAIRGAAELLQEDLPPAERTRFTRNVETESARLTQMIDKLLALAAVEQQGWLQKVEPVPIADLVTGIAEQVAATARGQGVDVIVGSIPAGLLVSGDAFLLRQAIHNLVDNAIAFSAAGSRVEIAAKEDAGKAVVSVCDRGPGVPEYATARVFERFYSLPRPGSE